MEDAFKSRHKGNRVPFEFNEEMLQIAQNLSWTLNNDDTTEDNNICNDLTEKLKRRNKLAEMTDRSVLGWDTWLPSTRLIQSLVTQMMER